MLRLSYALLFLAGATIAAGCGDSGTGAGGAASSAESGSAVSTAQGSTASQASASASSSSGGIVMRRVFVTSMTYAGDLGSLAAMDAACQTAATTASLGGTWQAWLAAPSDPTAMHFAHGTGPYVLVSGAQIAADWADLTDGTLGAPINHDENGNVITTADPYVWTGGLADGVTMGATCDGWINLQTGGWYGSPLAADNHWSFQGGGPCSSGPRRLYCFER
jgi:hypothetical protein